MPPVSAPISTTQRACASSSTGKIKSANAVIEYKSAPACQPASVLEREARRIWAVFIWRGSWGAWRVPLTRIASKMRSDLSPQAGRGDFSALGRQVGADVQLLELLRRCVRWRAHQQVHGLLVH